MKTNFLSRQTGTSLLEVVVTIVIISIGLLGLAGLQLNSMKFQKSASQRSEAVQSAYDLSERMRANGAGVSVGGVATNFYNYTTAYATTIATLPTVPTCAATVCTASEVASIDSALWLRNLGTRLNGGAGYITPNAVGGYDVTVMWRERNDQTDAAFVDPACPTGATAPGAGVHCYVVRFTP